jgi:hexosaminidase
MEPKEINIIPKPVEIKQNPGFFEVNKDCVIFYDDKFKSNAEYLSKFLQNSTGYELKTEKIKNNSEITSTAKGIIFCSNSSKIVLPVEGYLLTITKQKIIIESSDVKGNFYGIQTIRQLLPPEIESAIKSEGIAWKIPCVKIKDYPRFYWRGFMLDEVRHFFGMTFVKRMIDLMALHKLNKLHWHITDDEGWRIEIKKYPLLTSISSRRILSKKRNETPNIEDPKWYGGYYTQEEVKIIIEYANKHYIEIIPELEMPGHATAPLVAYPDFSCAKPGLYVPLIGMGERHAYCAGNFETFKFLKTITDEVIGIFPTDKIHIGGDELPEKRWKNCATCQKFMQDNNIKDIDELQVYFASEMIKHIQNKGMTAIGWFDFSVEKLLEKKIDPEKLLFQFWVGSEDKVVDFIRKGGQAIISNHRYTYLDYSYFSTSLKKAYNFEPIPKQLEKQYHNKILGIEAPIWCERVTDWKIMDYRVFPRLTAIAETAWSLKQNKNYKDFKNRLKLFLKRMDILTIYYAPLFEAENSLRARIIPKARKL